VRVRRVPQKPRSLAAQRHDARDGRVRVGFAAIVTAVLERLPHLFAQVAARRERQKRIDTRACVHDRPFSRKLSFFGCRLVRGAERRGQASQIRRFLEQHPAVLVRQDLVAEIREQHGELLIDAPELLLLCSRQLRPGLHESIVSELHEPLLLGSEPAASRRMNAGQARKQLVIENDRVVRLGQPGRPFAVHRLHVRGVEVARHHRKQHLRPILMPAGVFERSQRVRERGRLRVRGNHVDLGEQQRQPARERRWDRCDVQPVPGRHTGVRPGPGREQRILFGLLLQARHGRACSLVRSGHCCAIGLDRGATRRLGGRGGGLLRRSAGGQEGNGNKQRIRTARHGGRL
jgi:hypothetical protein